MSISECFVYVRREPRTNIDSIRYHQLIYHHGSLRVDVLECILSQTRVIVILVGDDPIFKMITYGSRPCISYFTPC